MVLDGQEASGEPRCACCRMGGVRFRALGFWSVVTLNAWGSGVVKALELESCLRVLGFRFHCVFQAFYPRPLVQSIWKDIRSGFGFRCTATVSGFGVSSSSSKPYVQSPL